jgi:hypothetical protein
LFLLSGFLICHAVGEKNFLTTSGNKCWCNGGIKKCSFYVYLPWLNIDIKKYTKYKILKLLGQYLATAWSTILQCIYWNW